jgi:hypothetical protein
VDVFFIHSSNSRSYFHYAQPLNLQAHALGLIGRIGIGPLAMCKIQTFSEPRNPLAA